MSTIDLILIGFLVLGGFKGYKQGFIIEVFSFLAFFIGLFLALELTIPVSLSLFGGSSFFGAGAVVVFIALFILLSILIKTMAKAIKKAVDLSLLGGVDNILGLVIGVLKWAFVLSVVFWVFDSIGIDLVKKYSDETLIFPYIVGIGPKVFEWVSLILPIFKDLLDSMDSLPEKNSVITYLLINK